MTALTLQPRGSNYRIPTDNPLATISEGLTKIPPLATDADGKFTLTFDTADLIDELQRTANAAYKRPELALPTISLMMMMARLQPPLRAADEILARQARRLLMLMPLTLLLRESRVQSRLLL